MINRWSVHCLGIVYCIKIWRPELLFKGIDTYSMEKFYENWFSYFQ